MDTKLNEILEKSKSMSDVARFIFGSENYTNRQKCKKILEENGIDWEEWLKVKKEKPKKYCLYCGKEITGKDYRQKFCNSSCAGSYNNKGFCHNKLGINGRSEQNQVKKERKKCLNCGVELKRNALTYCSVKCHNEYDYKQYIIKWKNGEENGISGHDSISIRIRRYLIEKNNNKCECCGWSKTNKYTGNVPLQIHHIDGDCTNNKEENLQLLCPNCHSLTETFGSIKNHKSNRIDRRTKYYKKEIEEDLKKNITEVSRCIVCGRKLKEEQITYCSENCKRRQYIKNITKDDILKVFEKIGYYNYEKAAKYLDISRTCLVNKCKKFGIKE